MGADDQIFSSANVPLHDLFQKQVREVLEQSDLDEDARQAILGGAELPVLRRRRDELHGEDQRNEVGWASADAVPTSHAERRMRGPGPTLLGSPCTGCTVRGLHRTPQLQS